MPAFTIGLFIALLTFFILYQDSIITLLRDNNLLPKPEPLTELYFRNHLGLTIEYYPGQDYPVEFVVHNLEYKPMNYTYEVTAATEGGVLDLAKGSLFLKPDEYKEASESFKLATGSGRTKIGVTLLNKQQNIHFWVIEFGAKKK